MARAIENIIRHIETIWALTWMNFLPRNRREGMKLLWVIAEPAGQLVMMIMIFSLIGRAAGYGNSFAVFLLTGIVVLTHFTTGSQLVLGGVTAYGSKTRLPTVGIFHTPISRIIFKAIVAIIYTTLLLFAISMMENVNTVPHHPFRIIGALFWVSLLSFGMGLIRGYAVTAFNPFEKLYAILSRVLIFVSGVFFVPSFMPPQLREFLAYNPVLHGVEALRLGLYDQYPTIIYSPTYLQNWALGTTALGLCLLWTKRNDFYK